MTRKQKEELKEFQEGLKCISLSLKQAANNERKMQMICNKINISFIILEARYIYF